MHALLLVRSAACLIVPALLQDGPTEEPPLRARVTLDGEEIEVALGATATTADGRSLRVDLLPVRTFQVPGAFAFDYPRAWEFHAQQAENGAWWTVTGDGAWVHVRTTPEDPQALVEREVAHLMRDEEATRKEATTFLNGIVLQGVAVTYHPPTIGPYPRHEWVQETYGWTDEDGQGWVISAALNLEAGPGASGQSPVEFKLVPDGKGDFELELEDPETVEPRTAMQRITSGWRWE